MLIDGGKLTSEARRAELNKTIHMVISLCAGMSYRKTGWAMACYKVLKTISTNGTLFEQWMLRSSRGKCG